MLDILSNCMEIASPEAVFWGGGYRFNIKPHVYPFKRSKGSNRVMDDLYQGRIFGSNGAIAHGLEGILNFGRKTDADGNVIEGSSFEWSNLTSRLGDILGQTIGALGSMLASVSSALFGEGNALTNLINAGTNALAPEDVQKKGTEKLNNMFSNLNKMWKDKVIKETTMPSVDGMRSILSGEPTGNCHLTIGNPLNPIIVCGNLFCSKMEVEFGEELGPDDFPLEMKVTYTIDHAMARDKAAIQSMFNRGAGKIYKLPDYIKSVSDYESKVDPYTGDLFAKRADETSFWTPHYMSAGSMGAHGFQTFKITPGKPLPTHGNSKTTLLPKFMPADPEIATPMPTKRFFEDINNRVTYKGNFHTRKYTDD